MEIMSGFTVEQIKETINKLKQCYDADQRYCIYGTKENLVGIKDRFDSNRFELCPIACAGDLIVITLDNVELNELDFTPPKVQPVIGRWEIIKN